MRLCSRPLNVVCLCVHQELAVCAGGHATTPVVSRPPGRPCDPRFTQPTCLFLQSQVGIVHAGQQHQLGLHAVSLTPAERLMISRLSGGKVFTIMLIFSMCFLFFIFFLCVLVFHLAHFFFLKPFLFGGKKTHQRLTWWQGDRFHCKLTAS